MSYNFVVYVLMGPHLSRLWCLVFLRLCHTHCTPGRIQRPDLLSVAPETFLGLSPKTQDTKPLLSILLTRFKVDFLFYLSTQFY